MRMVDGGMSNLSMLQVPQAETKEGDPEETEETEEMEDATLEALEDGYKNMPQTRKWPRVRTTRRCPCQC